MFIDTYTSKLKSRLFNNSRFPFWCNISLFFLGCFPLDISFGMSEFPFIKKNKSHFGSIGLLISSSSSSKWLIHLISSKGVWQSWFLVFFKVQCIFFDSLWWATLFRFSHFFCHLTKSRLCLNTNSDIWNVNGLTDIWHFALTSEKDRCSRLLLPRLVTLLLRDSSSKFILPPPMGFISRCPLGVRAQSLGSGEKPISPKQIPR